MKTTDEMDGIFTEAEKERSYLVWFQCASCLKWTCLDMRIKTVGRCQNCSGTYFDPQSATSDRTFDPIRASKRKIARKRK